MSEKKTDAFFDKAVFGGYDTTQVDEFVEEARKLLSGLKKENEVLKQKLTILADAVEEYRAAETSKTESIEGNVETTSAIPAEQNADAIEVRSQLESELKQLRSQLAAERAALEALQQEKANFTAVVAKQYEQCLRTMQAETTTVEAVEESKDFVAANPVKEDDSVASETVAAEEEIVASEMESSAENETAEPNSFVSEQIAEAIANTAEIPVGVKEEPETVETVEDTKDTQTAEAMEASEVPAAEANPEPIPSIAETVEAGESVYLNTDAAEVATLSYEDALAMVLRKNGIIRDAAPQASAASKQPATAKSTAEVSAYPSENEEQHTTKIIPRIQTTTQNDSEPEVKEPKKKKERKLFGGLRRAIHNFLEDETDDDLEVFTAATQRSADRDGALQFGKAYNVKKDK